jgi:hypothetical protein
VPHSTWTARWGPGTDEAASLRLHLPSTQPRLPNSITVSVVAAQLSTAVSQSDGYLMLRDTNDRVRSAAFNPDGMHRHGVKQSNCDGKFLLTANKGFGESKRPIPTNAVVLLGKPHGLNTFTDGDRAVSHHRTFASSKRSAFRVTKVRPAIAQEHVRDDVALATCPH